MKNSNKRCGASSGHRTELLEALERDPPADIALEKLPVTALKAEYDRRLRASLIAEINAIPGMVKRLTHDAARNLIYFCLGFKVDTWGELKEIRDKDNPAADVIQEAVQQQMTEAVPEFLRDFSDEVSKKVLLDKRAHLERRYRDAFGYAVDRAVADRAVADAADFAKSVVPVITQTPGQSFAAFDVAWDQAAQSFKLKPVEEVRNEQSEDDGAGPGSGEVDPDEA